MSFQASIAIAQPVTCTGFELRPLTQEIGAWKRLADTNNRSTRYFSFEGRIVGLDEYHQKSIGHKVSYEALFN